MPETVFVIIIGYEVRKIVRETLNKKKNPCLDLPAEIKTLIIELSKKMVEEGTKLEKANRFFEDEERDSITRLRRMPPTSLGGCLAFLSRSSYFEEVGKAKRVSAEAVSAIRRIAVFFEDTPRGGRCAFARCSPNGEVPPTFILRSNSATEERDSRWGSTAYNWI